MNTIYYYYYITVNQISIIFEVDRWCVKVLGLGHKALSPDTRLNSIHISLAMLVEQIVRPSNGISLGNVLRIVSVPLARQAIPVRLNHFLSMVHFPHPNHLEYRYCWQKTENVIRIDGPYFDGLTLQLVLQNQLGFS